MKNYLRRDGLGHVKWFERYGSTDAKSGDVKNIRGRHYVQNQEDKNFELHHVIGGSVSHEQMPCFIVSSEFLPEWQDTYLHSFRLIPNHLREFSDDLFLGVENV